METIALLEREGSDSLRNLAALHADVDGVEALHHLVAEILGQISTQDAWAGRTPARETPHACGGCGRWQQVRVPFLHHACESCKCLWVPGHCSRCGRTAAMPLSEFDGTESPHCGCGSTLKRLTALPLQPLLASVPAEQTSPAFSTSTTRRTGLMIRMSSVAAALVAIAAVIAVGTGQGRSTPTRAIAPVARPAIVVSGSVPATHGAAMGVRLRAAGLPTTPFACDAALSHTMGASTEAVPSADRLAFVNACTG